MYTKKYTRHYLSWKLMLVEVLFIRVHSHNNRTEEHLDQRSDFTHKKRKHNHQTSWFILEIILSGFNLF